MNPFATINESGHVQMSHVTYDFTYDQVMPYMSESFHMGWLRLVGSINLQVSFAEYRLFYRVLLQKRPMILSILLTEATPHMTHRLHMYVT